MGPRWNPMDFCHLLGWAKFLPFVCICQCKRHNLHPPTHTHFFFQHPPQPFQNTFYFILLSFYFIVSSPHQEQPTSCCMGTYFSAQSRCYCLKIPNKIPLATIKSVDLEALYNFQSKWH